MPIALDIICPEELVLSATVEMVVIPASEGDMGVLEGHAPIMVALRGGIVAVYENDRVTKQWFVSGGFAEVTPAGCSILADEAIALEDLDRLEAEDRLREAEAALLALGEAEEDLRAVAQARVQSAGAMIEAASL